MSRATPSFLKFHAAPAEFKPVGITRRVDFLNNEVDQMVIACVFLGWNAKHIARHLGLTPGQVTYRYNKLLGLKLGRYRGESELSEKVLERMKDAPFLMQAEKEALTRAKVSAKMDTRRVRVLA